jgi:hypothetical protein
MSSSLPVSSTPVIGLTLAIAVILLASNFTIINAQQQQQQLTSQAGELGNRTAAATTTTTTANAAIFQGTNDSFSIQVSDGWIIHDVNNTGSVLSDETRLGYGLLAQLCLEEEHQQRGASFSSNASASTNNTSNNNSCQGSQEELVHIIRYPDLDTRLLANNVIANSNAITTDNILTYHLQKLQEVGYRSIQIINSTNMAVNLTNPQTNETIATVPAKFVEMTYSTAIAPNEISRGHFLSTSTNATVPNPWITKGYGVFYEGNANNTNTVATLGVTTTPASSGLQPVLLPSALAHMFDSFELIAAPEVAQVLAPQGAAVGQTEGGGDEEGDNACDSSYPDTCIPPPPPNLNCDDDGVPENFEVVGSDPHGFDGDNDGIGCESGSSEPDDSEEDNDGGGGADDGDDDDGPGDDDDGPGDDDDGPGDDDDGPGDDDDGPGDDDEDDGGG